jgi:hypothetical protein
LDRLTVALPKVAICFPSADMVHADFALALAGLCNATPPLETPIVNNKSSIVAAARNDGVRRATTGCGAPASSAATTSCFSTAI